MWVIQFQFLYFGEVILDAKNLLSIFVEFHMGKFNQSWLKIFINNYIFTEMQGSFSLV